MSARNDDLVTQTAAFLFWDTVGSTAMLEELGEERTERLRRRLFASVRDVVAANRGQVVKSTGDGMMVAFPSALADALTCAVGIQRVVAVLRPHVDGAQLEVRVGVSAGDAVRSWDERDWYGASVNTAARLCDAAGSGAILATAALCDMAGWPTDGAVAMTLKGFDAPVSVVDVPLLAASDGALVSMPPLLLHREGLGFIGRTEQLAALDAAVDRLSSDGAAHFKVVGPAGSGKSRLVREWVRHRDADRTLVLASSCRSGGVNDALGAALDWYAAGLSDAQLRHLASDPTLAAVVPTASRRLGIRNATAPSSADVERALIEALRMLASSSTVIVVVDKVDDDDRVTIDRMALFLDRSPVLLVSMMSSDLTNVEYDIAVGPLDREELGELVAGELPTTDDVVAEVTDALMDATAGVALQATEVLLALRGGGIGRQSADSIGQVVRSVANMASPYRGLRRLRPEHHALFFGRDAALASVVGAVQRSRVVLVSGASGSGKSSLLGAGVIPAVELGMANRSSPWVTATFTPGSQPLRALRRTLGAVGKVDEAESLDVAFDEPLLVVVDQFEEIWTLCDDDDERSRFVGHLFALASDPAQRCRLLLGLRSDFLAHALTLPDLREVIERAHVPLAAPTEPDLRRMIEGPAEVTGYQIDEALVERLLADVRDEPGALPLMSHALYETWRRREGRQLTLDGYLEAGATAGAIAATAESVVASFDRTRMDAARALFGRLVTLGEGQPDTRRRVRAGELTEAERAVAASFVDARLLTAADDDMEVAHEALILNWPRLREWLEQDRDDLRIHRRLTDAATAWDLVGRDPGDLYRTSRLADARDLAARNRWRLNDVEDQFLSASEEADAAAQQQVQRRRRWTTIALGAVSALLVLALVAGTLATVQWRRANEREAEAAAQSDEADRQRSRADERRIDAETAQEDAEFAREQAELAALTSTATQLAGTEPRAALALGVEAYRRGEDLAATQGLLAALATRTGEQRPVAPAENVYDEEQQCYRSGGTNIDPSTGDWWGVSGSDVVVRSIDGGERTVYAGARPTECAEVYVLSDSGFRAIAYDDGLLWVTDDIDDFGDPIEIDPDTLGWFDFVDGLDRAALVMTLPEGSGIGLLDLVAEDGTRTRLAPGGLLTNGKAIPGAGQALVLTGPLDDTAFGASTALLVELSSGDPVGEFPMPSRADGIATSADGGTVAVGHRNGVTVIDVAERRVVVEIAEPGHESFALDRTGSSLALLRPDDIVTYDLPSGNVRSSEPAQRDVLSIFFLSDGRLLRVDEQGNPSLRTPSSPLVIERMELAQTPRATFNAREGTVTVVDPPLGRIEVFDVATGASRQVIEVVTDNGTPELIEAAGHVAGDTVLAVSQSMEVVRLERGVETGRLRLAPPGVEANSQGGSLQDDVVLLGSVGDAVNAYVIDPERFVVTQELLDLEPPSKFPTTGGGYVSPRPGGGAAVVHERGVVEFLDAEGEIESSVSFAGGVPDAAATHRSAGGDSITFVAAGSLWTAENGSSEAREIGRALRTWSVDVSPDGELALTSDFDGVVQAWHVPSGTLLGALYQGGSWIAGSPAFTEDGSSAYVQFADHVVRLSTDADQWVALACDLIGQPFTTDEWRLHAPPGTEPGDACPVT